MSVNASDGARYAPGGVARDGSHQFYWNLTSKDLSDPVQLVLPPKHVLPVVFVPGIMGSNLRKTSDHKTPVWRLDEMHGWKRALFNRGPLKNKPVGLAIDMAGMKPGERQKLMHPDRVEVDPSGHVPDKPVGSITDPEDFINRGWGEVGESSYMAYLLWLEERLNGQGYNPATWQDFYYTAVSATPKPGELPPAPRLVPGIQMSMRGLPKRAEIGDIPAPVTSDELLKRAGFRMPVYACGYNWLANNLLSAAHLQQRINQIIAENNGPHSNCSQVIVVTHSMGGLVARACQKLQGMQDKIAGIVHGVMPTTGAAVAYRRCKVGMRDEDFAAGLAIGETGQAVTAVFAQAPGALELLPMMQYEPAWLTFGGKVAGTIATAQPVTGDPYRDIYLRKDRWWGLVRPEWLRPQGGMPITWSVYRANITKAKRFTNSIKDKNKDAFHPVTYVFYGNDSSQKSFAGIHWRVAKGAMAPHQGSRPELDQVPEMSFDQVRANGNNPIHVGGKHVQISAYGAYGMPTSYETSYWDIQCGKQDSGGDGTVPIMSGSAPKQVGGSAIKQQFGLTGFAHEGAYRNPTAQIVSLYGIVKIAAEAKVPA